VVVCECLEYLKVFGVALIVSIYCDARDSLIAPVLAIACYEFYVLTVFFGEAGLELVEAS